MDDKYLELIQKKLTRAEVVDARSLSTMTSKGWVIVDSYEETVVEPKTFVAETGRSTPNGWIPDRAVTELATMHLRRFLVVQDEASALAAKAAELVTAEAQHDRLLTELTAMQQTAKAADEKLENAERRAANFKKTADEANEKRDQARADAKMLREDLHTIGRENDCIRKAIGEMRYKQILDGKG